MAKESPPPEERVLETPADDACHPDLDEKTAQKIVNLERRAGDLEARKIYAEELTEYVKVHRDELRSLTRMRRWGVMLAYLLIAVLTGVFVCVIFYETKVFDEFEGHSKTAFIIATVSGSVILMTVILRGLFGYRHRELLPGNLQQYVDAAKDVLNSDK